MKKKFLVGFITLIVIGIGAFFCYRFFNKKHKVGNYYVISMPTPNVGKGTNDVNGIILHHTANKTIYDALGALCNSKTKVSCHVIIDKDGTRYILAKPTSITWHAGYSMLNGRERCNEFTIGIEFQGNTKTEPLTNNQINSAIDYISYIMKHYDVPIENIITHEMIRHNWIVAHPEEAKTKNVLEKVDITQSEYKRFMGVLKKRLKLDNNKQE